VAELWDRCCHSGPGGVGRSRCVIDSERRLTRASLRGVRQIPTLPSFDGRRNLAPWQRVTALRARITRPAFPHRPRPDARRHQRQPALRKPRTARSPSPEISSPLR
jgi:hypothetical protein